MPTGIYNHKPASLETRKKMSNAKKGRMPKFIPNNTGRVHSEETKKKISISKKGKPSNRKGVKLSDETRKKISAAQLNADNPSLSYIHRLIEKRCGKPNYCEHCKCSEKKKYEWSNKNHKYSLKKEDWQRLCPSCHRKYDIKNNQLKK